MGSTLTTATTVTLPDISPYIIDDGIQSFTANTADLYKNTSVKYAQSVSSKTASKIGQKLNNRVITPIAVKYLIDYNAQKKIKINIDSINGNPFRTATV